MSELLPLEWVRPAASEFPKVWRTFKAADLDSDELIEYRIQDLPEDRFDDAIKHLLANYMMDEPITSALHGSKDEKHIADFSLIWRSAFQQRCTLVCFREGSDDIVGVNVTYVSTKGETTLKDVYDRSESPITRELLDLMFMLYKDFDPCNVYDVPIYLSSFGLSVDKRFRGRNIGTQLLDSRRALCREFGLKISHSLFSSFFSIRSAARAGFKVEKTMSFEELRESHPEFVNIDPIHQIVSMQTLIV